MNDPRKTPIERVAGAPLRLLTQPGDLGERRGARLVPVHLVDGLVDSWNGEIVHESAVLVAEQVS